ncbi:MAG: type I-MYXAN CRISPR-associated protein Cas6/Cmx6 [Burkholderiales bacterium]
MGIREQPAAAVDIAFDLEGKSLPRDNCSALLREVVRLLPWVETERHTGIHHVRAIPTAYGTVLLARRAKLVLRIPEQRVPDANRLAGQTLDIGGYSLTIGSAKIRPLLPFATLFAHLVVTPHEDEEIFEHDVAGWLDDMEAPCKLIGGKRHVLRSDDGEITGFSLMLHGLTPERSVLLQQLGLGDKRKFGCGIFIPHKGIAAVGS